MLTNKKIMIQKESAIRIIECFNRLGQDYYSNLYSEEDIEYARQRLIERGLTESEAESFPYEKDESNPFNSRHDAKVFIKWLQKYFGITTLLARLLLQGTKKYSSQALALAALSVQVSPIRAPMCRQHIPTNCPYQSPVLQ